jgi:SAM-dependent methyltransferase
MQVDASVEPEAAFVAAHMHVPRLVTPRESTVPLVLDFESLTSKLDEHLSQAAAAIDMAELAQAFALLDRLCTNYIRDAMRGLREASVPAWHHKLLYRWFAKQTSCTFEKDVVEDEASYHLTPELKLVDSCGPRLADALSNNMAYQELLFPAASMELVLAVYEDSVVSGIYNKCIVAAIRTLASASVQRRVVVLEVGAGTGGTASGILPVLDGLRAREYLFTDVSAVFLRQARLRFAQYTFVEYSLLNIDADPRLQGFSSSRCDLVVAANVLHATPYVRNAVRHCHQLLAPGGMLIANELLCTSAFLQTTFGLTEGWWLFSESRDPERAGQESPLLSWRQWQALFADCGFNNTHCVRGEAFLQAQGVLIAQTPALPRSQRDNFHPTRSLPGGHILSGGLGGLGLLAARLLLERGARKLLLLSRSGRVAVGSGSDAMLLARNGGDVVRRMRCDVSDDDAVRRMMRIAQGEGTHIRGIFHAAHRVCDGALVNQNSLNFVHAFGPKVHGVQSLHAAAMCPPGILQHILVDGGFTGLGGAGPPFGGQLVAVRNGHLPS